MNAPSHPYQDSTLTSEQRADDLLSRLPLEDKAGLMFHPLAGIGAFDAPGPIGYPSTQTLLDRRINHVNILQAPHARDIAQWVNAVQAAALTQPFAIPFTISSDPRHAFGNNPGTGVAAGPFSQWPEPLGFGALDDPELMRHYGDIVRREYRAVGISVALHPQIDLATDPRWSRAGGTFGDNVDIVRRLGVAYIQGLRGERLGRGSVAAMGKHFPGGGPQLDGEDPHFPYGKEQVYPGGMWEMHLQPFRDAISAGLSQMMPYYGVPMGTEYDEVGFSFNREIVTGLLRGQLGFDGIVCSDWGIIGATPWGVEHLSFDERMRMALDAGIDQFGGEAIPDTLIALVRSGAVAESRIDESARRLLREKFTLGLFDDPFVDADEAAIVVGAAEAVAAGLDAQCAAHTLLTNDSGVACLPLARGISVYIEGMDPTALAGRAHVVATPEEADVAIVRAAAPFDQRGNPGDLESFFHAGSLDFAEEDVRHLEQIATVAPVLLGVYLDRGAILTPLLPHVATLVADFGSSDEAFARVLFGEAEPRGRLPFELPSSMAAVQASLPNVPSDSADPLFPAGFGLGYRTGWRALPHPTDAERASTTLARRQGGRYRVRRTSIGLILKDPDARAILSDEIPGLDTHPMLSVTLGMDVPSFLTLVLGEPAGDHRGRILTRLLAL